MLRGPSEISSWFEKRFFSTHMKVAFLSVCFRAFFWVHKSISGNAHHVHQYIFISLQRSFFKRVVVLMRRAKSRRLGERPEQSRAMGRANKEELFRRKEKSTRRISIPFFLLLFFVFGFCGCVDFFHFFLGGRSS